MVTRTWVFQAVHLLRSAGVRLIRLRPVIQRISSQKVVDDERIFPTLFTTRNDKHPSWAARRIEQLASVVEWEAQDGLPTEQKVMRWACASCPIRRPKRACSRAFHVAIFVSPLAARHPLFSRLEVLWCSGPGSFCPMNGDRTAHEVTLHR